jgi:hypothetical protein
VAPFPEGEGSELPQRRRHSPLSCWLRPRQRSFQVSGFTVERRSRPRHAPEPRNSTPNRDRSCVSKRSAVRSTWSWSRPRQSSSLAQTARARRLSRDRSSRCFIRRFRSSMRMRFVTKTRAFKRTSPRRENSCGASRSLNLQETRSRWRQPCLRAPTSRRFDTGLPRAIAWSCTSLPFLLRISRCNGSRPVWRWGATASRNKTFVDGSSVAAGCLMRYTGSRYPSGISGSAIRTD